MKRNTHTRTSIPALVMALALCALYLLFSVGVLKATHFCLGREASVAYFTAESKKCACSALAAEGDHCCDDKQELVHLEDAQKSLSSFQVSSPAWMFLGVLCHVAPDRGFDTIARFPDKAETAQPPPKVLFEWHCSFVFYDKEMIA